MKLIKKRTLHPRENIKEWFNQHLRLSADRLNLKLSRKVGKKLNVNAIIMTIKRMEIDQLK